MDAELIAKLANRALALAERGVDELVPVPAPEILAAMPGRRSAQPAPGVAVIPVIGAISQRDSLFSFLTGGVSVDSIRAGLRAAIADPSVSGIVFEFDSPGGSVDGIDELAAEIRRSPKPTLAVGNGSMYSAAYWLGASADEVSVTPSGGVGSVGIIGIHQEASKAAAQAGVTTTLITAGAKKGAVTPWFPLSDDGRASLQSEADTHYGMFARTVALGRGTTVDTVKGPSYGEGDAVMAQKALKAGMVDHVETLDDAITRMGRGQVAVSRQRMAALTDTNAGLVADLPSFSERLAAVAPKVAELVEHAQARVDMRAKEGRAPFSAEDRQALAALADSLSAVAAVDAESEPPVPVPTPPNPAAHRRAQVALALAELGV